MPTQPLNAKHPPDQLALQFELPLFSAEETAPASPLAPSATPAEKRRLIQVGPQVLDYALRRSRRRSIGFSVDDQGLTITAPRWVTLAQIEEAIREKSRWIFTKIAEMRARRRDIPKVRWEDGGTLPYLGEPIALQFAAAATARVSGSEALRFDDAARVLHVSLPPSATAQQRKDRVQGWLQAEAKRIFAERLKEFEGRLGVKHRVFRLSSAATRWGSCSADGKILLNWRLIHFPMSSIDYVVAHELAHLKEMNHGPQFWRTVADILPGFEAARDHLKSPPPDLLPTL